MIQLTVYPVNDEGFEQGGKEKRESTNVGIHNVKQIKSPLKIQDSEKSIKHLVRNIIYCILRNMIYRIKPST